MPPAEFDEWIADQRSRRAARQKDGAKIAHRAIAIRTRHMVAMGRKLAESAGCFKCHSIDGSPHIGPTWLDLYMRKRDARRTARSSDRRRGLHHRVDDGPDGQAS